LIKDRSGENVFKKQLRIYGDLLTSARAYEGRVKGSGKEGWICERIEDV
jgi:hypothetical protein